MLVIVHGIEIRVIERDCVDLVIGLNARMLHEIFDKVEAGPDRLCAGKCLLGWFLYGDDGTVEEDTKHKGRHSCFSLPVLNLVMVEKNCHV